MYKFRRGFAALLMVFAIGTASVGVQAEPAAAVTLSPGTWTQPVSWFGCQAIGMYGNYGTAGFAQMVFLGNGCNGYAYSKVYTTQGENSCNLITAVFFPGNQGCGLMTNPTGVQASRTGGAWGIGLGLCADNVPIPYNPCYEWQGSVYG